MFLKTSGKTKIVLNMSTFINLRSQHVALPGRGILTHPFIWNEDDGILSPWGLFISWPRTLPKCSANPIGSPQVLGRWEAHLACAEAPQSWHTETWRPKWIESKQTAQLVARITICDWSRWGILWCIRWLANPILLVDGEACCCFNVMRLN